MITMNTTNPFLPSTHGHPNFNPTKNVSSNKYHLETPKSTKQPKPPDKPMTPYMRYSKRIWDDVRAQYPDLKVWEVSKIVGQMWRELDENERQKYTDEFEAEKIEYNELLKQYHNSQAYQQWIASLKMKESEERDSNKRKEKKNIMNSPQKTEPRYTLQPLDVSECEEYFSAKHLAAARYYRNNKLVNDIFNDTIVPENQTYSEAKTQILRRQVESLETYQKKLNEELKELEENFQQKKRELIESSEKFEYEMNKRFAPQEIENTVKLHYKQTLQKTLQHFKEQGRQQQQQFQQQQVSSNSIINNNESMKQRQQNVNPPLTNGVVNGMNGNVSSTVPIVGAPQVAPNVNQQSIIINNNENSNSSTNSSTNNIGSYGSNNVGGGDK